MSQLVLITGGNGFLGSAVIERALRAGFHVRCAVRREDAWQKIQSAPALASYAENGNLTCVMVPDMTAENAYSKAVLGCSSIVHLAGPLGMETPGDLVGPAVAGTRNILQAAELEPGITRVVITSSVYALRNWKQCLPEHPTNRAARDGDFSRVPLLDPNANVENDPPVPEGQAVMERYVPSKVAARNEVLDFMATRKPHFNVALLLPGFVLGPHLLAKKKPDAWKCTNNLLAFMFVKPQTHLLFGLSAKQDVPVFGESVHIDDVADAHINALENSRITNTVESFLLVSDGPRGARWQDAEEIVKRALPEIAEHIPFTGETGTIPSNFDASQTVEKLLGRPFRSFDQQVRDVISWWASLPE